MIFKTQSTNKGKNKSTSDIECLDSNDTEDERFMEGDVATGKVLSTFNLGMSNAVSDSNTSTMQPSPFTLCMGHFLFQQSNSTSPPNQPFQ